MTSKSRVQTRGSRMPAEAAEAAAAAAAAGLKQSQLAQDQLEEAISGVMKAEQQLRDNSREVRGQLQQAVSRQQEALRCRELWLLSQVDLLETLKTEALQQQLQHLTRLRGQFDVIVHQLENSNSSHDLSNQLTSCMERLSSLSLTPEETPEMSFHGDTRSLRQAITSFGSISTQHVEGVASQSPAPSPAHQRAWLQSCPVVAKKQKTECGALSGWLLGSRPAGSAPVGYQSSKNPQDWLMARREGQSSCPVLASFDFLKAWGQLKDLEAWLLKDKTPVIRERANSSSSSSSSSFSIEKIDESEFNMEEEEEEGRDEEGRDEEDDELSDWLITPATGATETESDADRWRRVLKPFQESWSSGDWLPAAGRPAADCQTCCQTGRPLEIENLGKLKCLKTPPPSSPASSPALSPASSPALSPASSPALSPASPPAPQTPPASPLEAWLQQAPLRLQAACRANEPCSSFLQCVCEENCGREALSAWLLQQDGRDKNGVPVAKTTPPASKTTPPTLHHRDQEQKVQAILEAWLHPSKPSSSRSPVQVVALSSLSGWVAPEEEKASREEHSSHFKPSSSSLFQAPLDPERWVVPLPEKNSSSSGSGGQPRPPPEEDKWLLRKRSQAQERLGLPAVCDLFSCMKVGGDKDKWLHSAPIQM